MVDFFVEIFKTFFFFDEIVVFLIAAMPISEIRGALPVGILLYEMPGWYAFLIAYVGNIVPVFLILAILGKTKEYLEKKSSFLERTFTWLYKRTHKKHLEQYQVWGAFFLFLFVAIPLPFTGAWSGSLAAVVFDIPVKRAFPAIALGIGVAGVIVYVITQGIILTV